MRDTFFRKVARIMDYSLCMLKSAGAGDWEKVVEVKLQRNFLVKELFSMTLDNEDDGDIISAVQGILAADEKLKKMAIEERNIVKNQYDSVVKGRRAVSAYAENS